jgi:hypothetical protein
MQHLDEANTVPHSIGTDDARGAVTGHNVRYVLAGGLFLIISAFMGVALLI